MKQDFKPDETFLDPFLPLLFAVASFMQLFVFIHPFSTPAGSFVGEFVFVYLLAFMVAYDGRNLNRLAATSLIVPALFILPSISIIMPKLSSQFGRGYVEETVTALNVQMSFLLLGSLVLILMFHTVLHQIKPKKRSHDSVMQGLCELLIRLVFVLFFALVIYSFFWVINGLFYGFANLYWGQLNVTSLLIFLPGFAILLWATLVYSSVLKRIVVIVKEYLSQAIITYSLLTLLLVSFVFFLPNFELLTSFWILWAYVGLILWHFLIFLKGSFEPNEELTYKLRLYSLVLLIPLGCLFYDLYYHYGTRYLGQYCPNFIAEAGVNHQNIIVIFIAFILLLTILHLIVYSFFVRSPRINRYCRQFQSYPYILIIVGLLSIANPWVWRKISQPYYSTCFVYKDQDVLFRHFSPPYQAILAFRTLDILGQYFMEGGSLAWHINGFVSKDLPIAKVPTIEDKPLGSVCRVNYGIEYLPGILSKQGKCQTVVGGVVDESSHYDVLVSYHTDQKLTWLPFSGLFPNVHYASSEYHAVPLYSGFGLTLHGYCAARMKKQWRLGMLSNQKCWVVSDNQAHALKPLRILSIKRQWVESNRFLFGA